MIDIKITLSNECARTTEYFLRKRYKSKASLNKLSKLAVLEISAIQAKRFLELKQAANPNGLLTKEE